MGFFSGFCSFCSSICSGIGGIISGAVSGLTNVLSVAGSAISGLVCGVIKGIASILGIADEKEKPEELGLKAEKAERNLEDFDSFEEYKEYLDAIELTDEDLEKLNDPEKAQAYELTGTGIYLQGINDYYGMDIKPQTFVELVKLGVKNPEDTKKFLDKCKESKINPDIEGMTKGELTTKEENSLVSTLKASVLEMKDNKEEISKRLDDMLSNL